MVPFSFFLFLSNLIECCFQVAENQGLSQPGESVYSVEYKCEERGLVLGGQLKETEGAGAMDSSFKSLIPLTICMGVIKSTWLSIIIINALFLINAV